MRFIVLSNILISILLLISSSVFAEQGAYVTPGSPRPAEAKKYYDIAVDYHRARNGKAANKNMAEKYYELAIRHGDSCAPINLGMLYRRDFSTREDVAGRDRFSVDMYRLAIDMGCMDAYQNLADAISNGWGTRRDPEKAMAVWRTGAARGSVNCLQSYGKYLYQQGRMANDPEAANAGIALMEKALAMGNGHAGSELGYVYSGKGREEDRLRVLREGARLGSKKSLFHLWHIYSSAQDGQLANKTYADKIYRLMQSINDSDEIRPVPDFDKKIPVKPLPSGKRKEK